MSCEKPVSLTIPKIHISSVNIHGGCKNCNSASAGTPSNPWIGTGDRNNISPSPLNREIHKMIEQNRSYSPFAIRRDAPSTFIGPLANQIATNMRRQRNRQNNEFKIFKVAN